MLAFIKKLYLPDGEFYKNVTLLTAPIALQSLITIGVNMLDTIMVGSLGEEALAATSLTNQFITIYHILCLGIGFGASVLVARYWGMKTQNSTSADKALKKAVCIMYRLCLGMALIFAVLTLCIPETLMHMYTADLEIIRLGSIYFRYSALSYFFLGTALVSTIILRNVGMAMMPLLVSIGAFFINLIANYAFIFGKLGMPRMEVAGAAVGTLIARLFEAGIICGYLLLRDKRIGFRPHHIFMKAADILPEYIRICIPVLISDAILAFGNNAVAMVIGRLGAAFVAANAITSVTQQLSTVVIQGVSQSGSIITGQILGAGSVSAGLHTEGVAANIKEKALRQGYAFLGIGLFLGIISALFILCSSGFIINAYQVSRETASIAQQLMLAISFVIVFQAANNIMTKGVLRGGGDTRVLMVADNIFLWCLSIPLGMLAGFVFHLPAFWIYTLLKIDQITKAIWCVYRLQSGKWIKKISTGS